MDISKLKAAAERVVDAYGDEWFDAGRQICTVHKSKIHLISLSSPENILELIAALESQAEEFKRSVRRESSARARIDELQADCREKDARIAELESQRMVAFSGCNRWADKFREAEKRVAELERSELQLIAERDNAEEALGNMYQAVIGELPQWSNCFGYVDAVDTVSEHLADENDSEIKWRDLALQFDGHRMQAICFLKQILKETPETEFLSAREFLKAGPLSGEEVLRNRIAALAPPAPVVPEDVFNDAYEQYLNGVFCGDNNKQAALSFLNACRDAMLNHVQVVPEPLTAHGVIDMHECGVVEGWNACLEEVKRLNDTPGKQLLPVETLANVLDNAPLAPSDNQGKSPEKTISIPARKWENPSISYADENGYAEGWNDCIDYIIEEKSVPPFRKGITRVCEGWNHCIREVYRLNALT